MTTAPGDLGGITEPRGSRRRVEIVRTSSLGRSVVRQDGGVNHDHSPASSAPVTRGRACVIRQGYFPMDPRVHREAVALADAGFEVDVIAIQQPGEPLVER